MSEYRFEIRKRLPLDGVGTRWDHYTELRDLFADGLIACENDMKYNRQSTMLNTRKAELTAAVKLIEARLALLAGFDIANESYSDFDKMLKQIEQDRKAGKLDLKSNPLALLSEGSNESKPQNPGVSSPKKDSQGTPDEPTGVS